MPRFVAPVAALALLSVRAPRATHRVTALHAGEQ
jgi:hypothetical protein